MKKGDVFIGRGDLPHAGASYDEFNARLHMYFDAKGSHRVDNTTYYVDFPANEVRLQQRSSGVCKHMREVQQEKVLTKKNQANEMLLKRIEKRGY